MTSFEDVRGRARSLIATIEPRLPSIAFLASVIVLSFLAGYYLTEKKWFPYGTLQDARKTLDSIRTQLFPPFAPYQFIDFSGGPIASIRTSRVSIVAEAPAGAAGEHFLLTGGFDQYLEYCPKHGCIAAEFARNGSLIHAYPYRPEEFQRHEIVSLPYESVFFRFTENMYPIGLAKLADGDLIVTFQEWNTFPFGGGVARVRPDGHVVWFRHDYSHHWPTLLPDGTIAVTAMRIAGSEVTARLGTGVDVDVKCDGKIENDIVRVLDPDGRVLQEISVLDAILNSPYRGMLYESATPCVPVHLNYVTSVTSAIAALYHDVSPNDLIVSLRNINAFAILGLHDHRLKHLFTGTFLRQHNVIPVPESTSVLIFDNHGADWNAGPSRVLAYDLATDSERTIFPNSETSPLRIFSDVAGNISISPDKERAIITSNWEGRAYEIRISDGKVLTIFNSIHDLRNVGEAGGGRSRAAGRFVFGGVYYVH